MCQNIRLKKKPLYCSIFFNYFASSHANPTLRWKKTQKHQTASTESIRLDVGVVGNRGHGLRSTRDNVTRTGLSGLSLQVKVGALLLSLALLLGVLLDTLDEVLTGAGVLDVFDADVDTLLDVAVVDDLIEEDTDGGLGHVVDDTGLTVEDLVGHTIVHHLSQRWDSL